MRREEQTTLVRVSQGLDYLHDGLDSVRQGIQVVTTTQSTEATQTTQKLDRILEQILKLSLERQHSNDRVTEIPDRGHLSPELPPLGPCSDLMASTAQLCQLFDGSQTRKWPIAAVNVVPHLLAIISRMITAEFLQDAIAANLLKIGFCKKCCRSHVDDLKACLTSVYSVLLSARHIAVNRQGGQY